MAVMEQESQEENLQESAERQEQLMVEAKDLLAKGDPWKALPKKAEALGLKSLEGFTSMAKQRKRDELARLGSPLSFSSEKFKAQAAAELYPDTGDANKLLEDLNAAASQPNTPENRQNIELAAKALDDIRSKSQELQYQQAFNEVGQYAYNSGYLAARAGNGDLLIAADTSDKRQALEAAGYKAGAELPVPFNNDAASTQDVEWIDGTGFDGPTT